ncbi:MAG: alpha/beta fold hydrolase, partial [Pseudomonadota bacterium]
MSGFDDIHNFTDAEGVTARYRVVGRESGQWALLLHGHTQTSLMWRACADELADKGFRVIVPDIGLKRANGDEAPFTKAQIANVFQSLIDEVTRHTHPGLVIGHDLGAMIAYALAATARSRIAGLAVLEATPPGVGFWQNLLMDPRAWHFGFYGPYA